MTGTVPTKIIKDPVHQFIELPADFVDTAVDSPIVQRLRRIMQLSLSHLVYPGATHTRFEHSIGVAYTMKKALHYIKRNIDEVLIPSFEMHTPGIGSSRRNQGSVTEHDILRNILVSMLRGIRRELDAIEGEAVTAALFHDTGHIALSHTAEEAFRDRILEVLPEELSRTMPIYTRRHEYTTIKIIDVLEDLGYDIRYNGERVDLGKVGIILRNAYLHVYDGKEGDDNGRSGRSHKGKSRDSAIGDCYSLDLELYQNDLDNLKSTSIENFSIRGRVNNKIKDISRRAALCIVSKLLSSSIDVDRADYILRDSIHTGSMSGIYDINRYYSMLTIVPMVLRLPPRRDAKQNKIIVYRFQFHLGVIDKGVSLVENMLLSRVYMYNDVYLHDISMIYSAMASRLIALLYIIGSYIINKKPNITELLSGSYKYIIDIVKMQIAYEKGEEFETILLNLIDDNFYSLVHDIVLGKAKVLIDIISQIISEIEDKNSRQWMQEICLAIIMLSYGIAYRRHLSAFVSTGEKTRKLIEEIKANKYSRISLIIENMVPLTGIIYAKYSPYKENIYVFRRYDPYTPVKLAELEQARVAARLSGESYAKLIVFFPYYESYNSLVDRVSPESFRSLSNEIWTFRRGKLERALLDGRNRTVARLRSVIEEYCGMDRAAIKEVFENSMNHAIAMASGLQAEP
ncbi:MAG: hypothetical protein GSR78_01640 [Desulfurococcales archaeon]|nr:hypothetical protein [Desulfurococcales archaeon]